MVAILSWARSSAAPESLTLVEMPAASSFTEFIALAAVYCALRTSFCERKLFTRFCSSASPCSSFCSSSVSCWCCGSRLSIWAWAAPFLDSASRARSSRPWREGGLGLVVEVVDRMLELGFLQLDLLAGGGDVDQRPADPGDLLEHLVIRVVEHLVRLLGGVKRLVRLGGNYVVRPLKKAHIGPLSIGCAN